MQPILIMGATSGIGALAVREALSRGLAVRAFARGAAKLPPEAGLEPFAGDARDPGDVARALKGVRAVIYALGIRERLSMLWEKETLFSDTTRVLLDAMPLANVSRLVAVTGFGAGRSHAAMSAIERAGHRAILGRPYADKDRQEAMIIASGLDWTIVRPAILTNGSASGRIRVLREPGEWRNGLISRADVAVYLIDAVEQGLDVRRDVVLARQSASRHFLGFAADGLLIACSRSSAKKIGRSYVITRELCQVAEPHGGQAIFECLDKVMPGLARRKR